MATEATQASPNWLRAKLDEHHFLLRRLHSLTGVIPVGVFVIFHLFTNFQMSSAIVGQEGTFQHEVDFIHSMPALFFVELSLWLAIGFHAGLGLVYTFSGKSNVAQYRYADNWRYALQRWTGLIALVFVLIHVATLRWGIALGPLHTPFYAAVPGDYEHGLAFASTAYALQIHPIVPVIYLVGSLAVVFHWANGLWTAAITWGLTLTPRGQQRWGMLCAGMGVALAIFAVGAVWGALVYEIREEDQQILMKLMADESLNETAVRPDFTHTPIADTLRSN